MKFINADKLIKKFEKMIDDIPASVDSGAGYVIDEVYKIIDTLQEEQPDIIEHICLSAGISAPFMDGNQWSILKGDNIQVGVVGFGDTKEDALINFIKDVPLPQEQPEVDLEKELDQWRHKHFKGKRDGDYSGEYLERKSQLDLARHFYELGLNAIKEE